MEEGKLILTFENPHKDIRDPEHGDNTGLIGHKDPGTHCTGDSGYLETDIS